MDAVPPRVAVTLLRLVVNTDDFEAVSGDLEEIFRIDIAPRAGAGAARRWYWRQVLSIAVARTVRSHEQPEPHAKGVAMAAFRQDLGFAVRSLRKEPVFAVISALTLALGIGANVAIFSLVNAILLKPLPFADTHRLMAVHMLAPQREARGQYRNVPWSYPKYAFLREQQRVFDSTAIYMENQWNLTGSGSPERLPGEFVEATYLATLGVSPEIGRGFTIDETRAPGSAPIAMLTHGLWQRRFGGDTSVLGRTLGLNGTPHVIVGVLPPGFKGLSGQAEVLVPVMTLPADNLGEAWNHSYELVARLRAGVTTDQATAAVTLLGAQIDSQFTPPRRPPDAPAWSASAAPLDTERVDPVIRRSVVLMMVAVGAVLLIVCVNLANLMLVRTLGRQREVAIRTALGASRTRIVRQLMTESLLLSTIGAILGLGVAYGAVSAGAALLPDLRMILPRPTAGLTRVGLSTLGLDVVTLLFTFAIAVTTTLIFGLGPAWRVSRRDLAAVMRLGSGGVVSPGSRLGLRSALMAAEIALALVLLTAGGLMLKSVLKLQNTELGFRPEAVTTFRVALPSPQYDPPGATRLITELVARLGGRHDIRAVAYGNCAPLTGPCNQTSVEFPDRPRATPGAAPLVGVYWASPGYFDALAIRTLRGRVFDDHDRTGQPKVVVVNESAARAFWGADDPIGKRLSVNQGGFEDGAEVIGVVADVRYGTLESPVLRDVYIPLLQSPRSGGLIFVASRTAPAFLVPEVRREVQSLDTDLPLVDVKTMEARFDDATWRTRTSAWLLGVFALLALALAAVGIYGVVTQGVAQQTKEIGVRLALGATRSDILRLVLGRALAFAVGGVALGVAVAIPSMRLLTTLLYQVKPGDPIVLVTLALMLLAVAMVASYVPARRATRVDPLLTLRAD